ncbi:zinc finger protein 234-like [Schistocerca cancellata]|uniref:zinc finger protein 234-like n=1 Tax=Schistocerca cancellata TaxID=274614 RepID=UPI002117B65E|nr:zinc finger protein 234-like [Schistocerca cancellata]
MESQKALCEVCGKTFMFRKNLYKHMRQCHDMDVNLNLEFYEIMESLKALCEVCGKTFTFRKNLYKHMRKRHNVDVNNKDKERCKICGKMFSSVAALRRHIRIHSIACRKVSCTECNDFMCRSMRDLRNHLECQHGIKIKREEMEFESLEQFLQWKIKMEGEKCVSFVKKGGGIIDPEKFKTYYFCHRSGNVIKSGMGLRLRGPSVKIGRTCPASLIVTKMPSGKVSVQFYATHTGHNFSVGSLHLTPADRAMVADLIASGLSDTEILKKIRDGAHDSCFKRVHMLKRKDIYNIKKQYKLDTSLNRKEVVSVEQPSSIINIENLQTAAQNRCQLLKEIMASVGNENIDHYIESLDRLIRQVGVTIASQKKNFSGRQELPGPLHDHTYV